jgi:hypothetical protein
MRKIPCLLTVSVISMSKLLFLKPSAVQKWVSLLGNTGSHLWNPVLGNSEIQRLSLLKKTMRHAIRLEKKDLWALLEDIVAWK